MMKTILIPLTVAALLVPVAHAQTLMNIDFESDTVGALPVQRSSQTNQTAEGNIILVEDTDYTPSNPFGGKSLYMFAPITSSKSPGIWFQTTDTTIINQGSFTFDVVVDSSFLDLRLGTNEGFENPGRQNGPGAVRLLIGSGTEESTFAVYQNSNNGTVTEQAFAYGDQLSVTVSWNFAGETPGYSVSVDGTPLTISGGQSVFDFYEIPGTEEDPGSYTGINTVWLRLGTGTGTDSNYQVWADNLQMTAIPESSETGMLLGLVSILGFLVYRRKVAKS